MGDNLPKSAKVPIQPTAKKPRKGHSGKPAGRPKERIIGPKQLEEINRLILRGKSTYFLAEKFGVSRQTIDHHVEHYLKPLWREQAKKTAAELCAEVQAVGEENWDQYHKRKRKDLGDVRWALEQQAKLGGLYAAEKHDHNMGGEFRVAGITAEQALKAFVLKVQAVAAKEKAEGQ